MNSSSVYEKEAKKFILDFLKNTGIRQGSTLPIPPFVYKRSAARLSPKVDDCIDIVLDKLVTEGFFTYKNGSYILSEIGDHEVYGKPVGGSYENEAKEFIITFVRNKNLRTGDAFFVRAFAVDVAQANLNPNVKDKLNDAMNSLIESNYFELTDDDRILLTQSGYDLIY